MGEIRQTELPGVGVRYEFTTRNGRRIGVVAHRSGRRELFVSDPEDPDAAVQIVDLATDEGHTLAEMLGASQVARELGELQQRIEGLAIDWLPVGADSPYAGRTIADAQVRSRTGVSIVAIVRGEDAIPAPGPETTVQADDYLVVVGTQRGIEAVVQLLHGG